MLMSGRTRRSDHGSMTTRGTHLTAAAALVMAAPVAAWGLMGRQNAGGVAPSELDFAFQPWDVSNTTSAVIGAMALLLTGVGTVVLTRSTMDLRWWQVLGPLMLAGVMVGVGWRVLTAGVIGANIGAGLTLLLGGPVVGGLLLWALVRGVWLAQHRPGGGGRLAEFSPNGA